MRYNTLLFSTLDTSLLTYPDETRPICNRCKKRGLDCDGPKDPTWISQNNVFPPSPPEGEALAQYGNVPGGLSFIAFEDDICMAYTRKHLMRGGSVEMACDMVQIKSGLDDDAHNPGLSLLRKAVLSLSITFFGSQNRQKAITHRGYRQYGEVLRQLNNHLSQPDLQTSNETILTALTCTMLEVFLPTGPNNFLKHMRGIEAILDLRGPPVSADSQSATIFSNVRVLSIIAALAQGRPSVWGREDWQKLPPLFTSETSLIRHDIWKILADCSILMSESRQMLANNPTPEDTKRMLDSSNALLEKLKSIYPRWEKHNEALTGDKPTNIAKDFHIASHVSATTYMLYNAAFMCILRNIQSIQPTAKLASLRNAAALKIVRCLELKEYEKREGNAESNTIGFVATKVAWEALGGFSSPEGRRLARIVKSAANGTFAVGAWEHSEHHPLKKINPDPTDDQFQNIIFQPLWAEHHGVGKPEAPILTRREIINVGARPESPGPSFLDFWKPNGRFPPFASPPASAPFLTSLQERRRNAQSFLSVEHQRQSSEIINSIQGMLGFGMVGAEQ